tara:strand:+ start:68153 stop:68587 length:435 start_codon:yes stop_codon:yes gene_type:complete
MHINKDLIDGSKKAPKEAVEAMESLEDWAIDDKKLNNKINQMLEEFEDILKTKDIDKESFIRFLTYLHTGNMMKILNEIENIDGDFVEDLVEVVNELNSDKASRFSFTLANRIMVLYRMYVLPQIFSPERIEQLRRGIEIMKDE